MTDPEVEALAAALEHPDAAVRRIAVLQAADAAHDHPEPFARATRDPNAGVRLDAVRALEGSASDTGIDALVERLGDEDADVRGAAAESLAEILDKDAAPLLLTHLERTEGPARAPILAALKKLRHADALPYAIEALSDALPSVRREAVGVLGYLHDEIAVPALAAQVASDADAEVRRAAAGALGFSSSDAALLGLLVGLRDADWQTREEAAATLAKLALPRSAAGLVAALKDDYWQVRLKAAYALGRIKARDAAAPLIEALSHPVGNLRKEAAGALGAIGDRAAIPALSLALDDPDIEVRKAAQRALAALAGSA
jgi:HEAT repeat protein